jgi:hypothetical protein
LQFCGDDVGLLHALQEHGVLLALPTHPPVLSAQGAVDQAGVTERLWDVSDIVTLVEVAEAKPAKRGTYKRQRSYHSGCIGLRN